MARPEAAAWPVQVRLTGPPDLLESANAYLARVTAGAWHPGTRKPGRHAGGDHLQYGVLVIPEGEQ